jgi:Tfp pilus assembly protein PilV
MFIARTLDAQLGRKALTETVANGVDEFDAKYLSLASRDNSLPRLSVQIVRHFTNAR